MSYHNPDDQPSPRRSSRSQSPSSGGRRQRRKGGGGSMRGLIMLIIFAFVAFWVINKMKKGVQQDAPEGVSKDSGEVITPAGGQGALPPLPPVGGEGTAGVGRPMPNATDANAISNAGSGAAGGAVPSGGISSPAVTSPTVIETTGSITTKKVSGDFEMETIDLDEKKTATTPRFSTPEVVDPLKKKVTKEGWDADVIDVD